MLRGIDLAVAEHHAVALIGASGSGKSTLLRCIDLLEEIDDGDVLLDGEVVTDPSVDPVRSAAGSGWSSSPSTSSRTSACSTTWCSRRSARTSTRADAEEARARAARALRARGPRDDRPDDLSGGQQQRVAIARALATDPRALLLDEVTSALDPELVGEVLDAIRELKAGGMTMVIATHEMGFAREVADEVCFLHEGLILERGAPEAIFTAPERPETQRFLRRLLHAGRL